ncbi:hypothetical protein GF373_11005 [bacterium]|nr:hypothetical protein [bacterium]
MEFQAEKIKDLLIAIGHGVQKHIHHSLHAQSIAERTAVAEEHRDDTIFQIDRDVESIILPMLYNHAESLGGIVLVAEGISEESIVVFPETMREEDAAVRIIMDPIDGSRGIMYDKRSAFYLAGAAPNRPPEQTLNDIQTAVMVELPTSRAYLFDILWAVRGEGAHRVTHNIHTEKEEPKPITPSKADSILGGFGQISRFFPPGKEILAAIEEELIATLFPDPPAGKAILFNDQYISSGGQLYELLTGHDRFVADLRASLYTCLKKEGKWVGLTCHPYDVCAHLIGQEAGIIITDIAGNPFNAPMNTHADVDWIAYANARIQKEVEPMLLGLFEKYGMGE